MKLFLIKIGKAYTTLKRDGFVMGGRRIKSYLAIFLKTLFSFKSGDVLFITGGVGDSAFYRAYNQAEELGIHGIKSSVMVQDNPFLPLFANKYQIFIFHRTLVTPSISRLIRNIKKQNKEIIFDTDDLVFDVMYMHETDLYKNKMSAFERMQYAKGVGEEILKDPYVKVCTTTTSYLAKILEKYGKKVFIAPNKISNHELEVTSNILANIPRKISDEIKIAYFSGTMSHNKDFATITEALIQIMEKYPNVKLLLAGPLDVEDKLNKYKDRIIQLPLVSRDKYYRNVYKADINLAPLELGNPFCEAKSELKFFETGILKVPTVAVANQTYKEAITDGVDGYLARNTEEWVEKIEKLITGENLRQIMGKKARETVLANYTNKNSHNDEYYGYLRSKLKPEEVIIKSKGSKIEYLFKKATREVKNNSLGDLFRKLFFYYLGSGRFIWAQSLEDWKKKKEKAKLFLKNYEFIKNSERIKPNIVYILPGVDISGGAAVVLQHTNRLKDLGYNVRILTQDLGGKMEWFPNQKTEVIPLYHYRELLKEGIDILIATSWGTAVTMDLLPAKRKIYFVQSDERRFYDDISTKKFVEETYRIDCEYMTEARWIQKLLKDEFSHESFYVPNGLDEKIFHETQPVHPKKNKPRILIEGRPDIPFKGLKEAYEAVKDLDIELWIVASGGKLPDYMKYEEFFSGVPINDMKKIYSSCDIFLKLSRVEGFFGPPMEAMACGCSVVVGKVTGYDEYIEDGKNALVVETMDIEGAREAVKRLIGDRELRKQLVRNGYETAKNWGWDKSIKMLIEVIEERSL